MSTYSLEEVHHKFPVKTLPRCDGEPTYEYIHEMMMALYANAASIPTTLRGGAYGHIGLVMDDTLYAMLSGGTAYNTPVEPTRGALGTRATLADREQMEQTYKAEKAVYGNHNTVDEALKMQIQDAVEDIYLRQLKHKYMGYLGVTTI